MKTSIGRALAVIVGVGLACRVVRYAVNMPLWGDEAFVAVPLLTRTFASLSRPLAYYQIAPIGWLWAELGVVRVIGASEWALRLLPFGAGVASLGLFARFAAANLDRRSALMAVALMAASFYPIRHATEVKPYATDLFLSLAVTCLARAAWKAPDSTRAWAGLTAVGVIGVWASYPLVFVVAGVGMVLGYRAVATRSVRAGAFAIGFGGATLASWSVMYLGFGRPQALAAPFLAEMITWEDSFPPLGRPWAWPRWLLIAHTGNMLAYPYGGNHGGSLVTALLAARGVLVMRRRDPGLLALLLAPLIPALVAAALQRYPYGTSARISLYFAPAACLLAGRGLAVTIARCLPRSRIRLALMRVTAGLGVFAVAGAVLVVVLPYKARADLNYRRAVASLTAETTAGDRWIGFNGLADVPPTKNLMLMPWLQHAAQFHFYALRDAPVPLAWMPKLAETEPAPSGRTWFLVNRVGYDHFPESLLREHLARLEERCGAATVRRIEPRSGESIEVYLFATPRPAETAGGASGLPRTP